YQTSLLYLLVLSLVFLIFLGNLEYRYAHEPYYHELFEKHHVYSVLPEADTNNKKVMLYLTDPSTDLSVLDMTPFNEREKTHLMDVKVLIQRFIFVFELSLVIFVVGMVLLFLYAPRFYEQFTKLLLIGGASIVGIGFLLLLSSAVFALSFNAFHNVFFKPGTWLFLSSDYLISLYPFGFFRDFFIRIVLDSIFVGGVLALTGYILKRFTTQRQ
ncbi:MAG: DUF1461 domain-containing protein, partial [Candidatus Woesearchaeota archaeon]|nr:DUF1461 domain-containing protein [Candidatus Woesearchaeota archaeon]